jgi:hypothetical protein
MGLIVLAAIASASASQAAVGPGTVDLSWNTCAPVVADRDTAITVNGVRVVTAYASVLGASTPTSGYEVDFIYGDATANVPDAWNFSPAGCQGTAAVTMSPTPPAALSKSCPAFQQTAAALQIKDVNLVSASQDPYAPNLIRVVFANAFPTGVTPVPTTRYFMASVAFDHTFSVPGPADPAVACGNYETPMCFKMSKAIFIELGTGVEFSYSRGNSQLTFGGTSACGGVPARPTTWGKIKGQYRN